MKSYNWTIPASSFLIPGKFVIPDQSVNPVNFVIPALCRNLSINAENKESCIHRSDRKNISFRSTLSFRASLSFRPKCRNLSVHAENNESCIQRYDRKSEIPAFAGMTQGIHEAFITRSVSPITKDHLPYAT